MATKKRTENKQPGDDSALDAAVKQAAENPDSATETVVEKQTTTETLHLRDVRPED